jgi:hypothetical protein
VGIEQAIAIVTGQWPTLDEIFEDAAQETAVDDAIMNAIDGHHLLVSLATLPCPTEASRPLQIPLFLRLRTWSSWSNNHLKLVSAFGVKNEFESVESLPGDLHSLTLNPRCQIVTAAQRYTPPRRSLGC